jgi:prophage antirepressor-like protein
MQYELQIFEAEDHTDFRMLNIDGEPWFVLGDVCRRLDLKPNNGSFYKHAEGLDADEKRLIARSVIDAEPSTLKGEGLPAPVGASRLCINESGLYSLILRSNKPEAKRFKKWVTSEVLPTIRRTGSYTTGGATAFIKRYNENWDRIDPGYFSVISELVWWLWGRLAHVGHTMADKAPDGKELRPDVSVGRRFADWLRRYHPELADTFKTYLHRTPEIEIEARQYPASLLPHFRRFVDTVWIPDHSRDYFITRDPKAISYLPKLLPAPAGTRRLTGGPALRRIGKAS